MTTVKHAQSPDESLERVPLSSSPLPTADSDGEQLRACSLLEPECSSIHAEPVFSPKRPSLSQSGGHTCMPLLSPFAVVNSAPSSSELIRPPPTFLQHSVDALPPSPVILPVLSSTSSLARVTPEVLQSPFGINPKSKSSVSDGLFLSPLSRLTSASPMKCYNTGLENNGNPKSYAHKNAYEMSDSGESTAVAPTTPKVSEDASMVTSSSPMFALESAENIRVEDICGGGKEVTPHSQNTEEERDLQRDILQPAWMPSKSPQARETASILDVDLQSSSPNCRARPACLVSCNNHSKDSLSSASPPVIDESTKRPRDQDEKESIPVPKRMTLASQQKQHKKLASPFRSPLLSRPNASNIAGCSTTSPLPSQAVVTKLSTPSKAALSTVTASGLSRARTPLSSSVKAKSQFKSPLLASSSTSASPRGPSTRAIQELERTAQIIRRAIRIKKEGDEKKLEQLVKKWRSVGREVAWELWQIARDGDEATDAPYPGTNSRTSDSFSSNWGWATASQTVEANSWGWDKPVNTEASEDACSEKLESPTKLEYELFNTLRNKSSVTRTSMLPPTPRGAYYERRHLEADCDNIPEEALLDENSGSQMEGQPATQRKTLGTMLHDLGIAHETLGWDEDEGDFVYA